MLKVDDITQTSALVTENSTTLCKHKCQINEKTCKSLKIEWDIIKKKSSMFIYKSDNNCRQCLEERKRHTRTYWKQIVNSVDWGCRIH